MPIDGQDENMLEKAEAQALVSIEVRLHNRRKFYVEGDTLSGDLVVNFSRADCFLHKVILSLICTELMYSEERVKRCDTDILFSCDDVQAPTISRKFKFSARLPYCHGLLEPSIDVFDEGNCGIQWKLQATIDFTEDAVTQQRILDAAYLKVFSLPTELERTGNYLVHRRATAEGIHIHATYPKWLPLSPKASNLTVSFEFPKPTFVQKVDVLLYKYVTVTFSSAPRLFVSREPLGEVFVGAEVERLVIGEDSPDLQIQGPLPSVLALASSHFAVTYDLHLFLTMREGRQLDVVSSGLLVESPDPSDRTYALAMNKAHDVEPPAYSEKWSGNMRRLR